MRFFISLLLTLPTALFTQTQYDTICFRQYISNPPYSEFICDKKLCEGYCVSLFANGNIHFKGQFKEGQPVDSLFEFFSNGKLYQLFIPQKGKGKMVTYYKTGNLSSVHDIKNRYEKNYYENGQLKLDRSWSKNYKTNIKEYHANGELIYNQTDRKRKDYNKNGVLINHFRRKEILVLNSIIRARSFLFNKRFKFRHKYYDYTWKKFDSTNTLQAKLFFHCNGFQLNPFPNHISQIDEDSFEHVIIYSNHIEYKKLKMEYIKEDEKYVKKLITYLKEEGQWVKHQVNEPEKIYELIPK